MNFTCNDSLLDSMRADFEGFGRQQPSDNGLTAAASNGPGICLLILS